MRPLSVEFKFLFAAAVLVGSSCLAFGQQAGPLSPPDRSPVPLTDADQQSRLSPGAQSPSASVASQTRSPAAIIAIPARHVTSGNPQIDAIALEAASRYRIDPCLIISVMSVESGFNWRAVSPKGASGLMQLMPLTAVRFGVKDIFDPRENVMGGASYLRWLLDRFGGDVRLALAGYNAGEAAVESYGFKIPPFLETQNYVLEIYDRYMRLRGNQLAVLPVLSSQAADNHPVDRPATYNQIIGDDSPTSPPKSSSGK